MTWHRLSLNIAVKYREDEKDIIQSQHYVYKRWEREIIPES